MKRLVLHVVKYLQVAALFVILASAGVLMGEKSLTEKYKLEETRASLYKENKVLAGEIRGLERKVTLMRSDPKTFEKEAKVKLGMVRPDEMVYIFENNKNTGSKSGNRDAGLDK